MDVDITSKGEEEARNAGLALKEYPIDMLFTSALLRAIRTADIALQSAGKGIIEIVLSGYCISGPFQKIRNSISDCCISSMSEM